MGGTRWASAALTAAFFSCAPIKGQFQPVRPQTQTELREEHTSLVAFVSKKEPRAKEYLEQIVQSCDRAKLDPLLVVALIQIESEFYSDAISWIGAAGIMQLMPETAAELGMTVWQPAYYLAARRELKQYQKAWSAAVAALKTGRIAGRQGALWLTRTASAHLKAAKRGLKRYLAELKEIAALPAEQRDSVDQRLNAGLNISLGTQHLGKLVEDYHGDLRLALAAYHAGQAMIAAAGGIPFIESTINYQNKVINSYMALRSDYEDWLVIRALDQTKEGE